MAQISQSVHLIHKNLRILDKCSCLLSEGYCLAAVIAEMLQSNLGFKRVLQTSLYRTFQEVVEDTSKGFVLATQQQQQLYKIKTDRNHQQT